MDPLTAGIIIGALVGVIAGWWGRSMAEEGRQ